MTKWKKVAIGVVGSIVGCAVILVGGLMYLFQGMCGNDIHKSIASPNGDLKAVIFQRDCGATTGFSTQISILGAAEDLSNESGNIFSSDGHPENSAPKVNWTSENSLTIHRRAMVQIYNQEQTWGWPWNKVEVTYK